jgi:hypothetical protein
VPLFELRSPPSSNPSPDDARTADAALVARIRNGDHRAFETAFRAHHALPRALGAPAWALITLVASLVAFRPTLAQTQRPTYRPPSAAVDEARTQAVQLSVFGIVPSVSYTRHF